MPRPKTIPDPGDIIDKALWVINRQMRMLMQKTEKGEELSPKEVTSLNNYTRTVIGIAVNNREDMLANKNSFSDLSQEDLDGLVAEAARTLRGKKQARLQLEARAGQVDASVTDGEFEEAPMEEPLPGDQTLSGSDEEGDEDD